MKNNINKEELQNIVKESLSIADICRKLNIRPCGGNYKTINKKLKLWNIDTTHFTGAAWNVGTRFKPFGIKKDLKDILIENSTYTSTSYLKNRLYTEGYKDKKCEVCNLTTWNNLDIVLELDHINGVNGVNNDNRIENLRIICPNCHSQTTNFRGRNCNISFISENRKNKHNKHTKDSNKINLPKCIICDNICSRKNSVYCSYKCLYDDRAKNIPTKNDLISKLKKLKSFLQVAFYYKVSDNTIRKWCRKYDIPVNKKLLEDYINRGFESHPGHNA